MFKNLVKFSLIFAFSVSFSFSADMLNEDQFQNYDLWIKKNLVKKQEIGIGYTEKKIGIKYTVNGSIVPFDFGKSNFYTTFEVNDNRVETMFNYDIMNNKGFKENSLYIKPGIGFGLDIKSAALSIISDLNIEYNLFGFLKNWVIGFNYKYFITKQHKYVEVQETETSETGTPIVTYKTVCKDADPTNDKNYFSIFINYKF